MSLKINIIAWFVLIGFTLTSPIIHAGPLEELQESLNGANGIQKSLENLKIKVKTLSDQLEVLKGNLTKIQASEPEETFYDAEEDPDDKKIKTTSKETDVDDEDDFQTPDEISADELEKAQAARKQKEEEAKKTRDKTYQQQKDFELGTKKKQFNTDQKEKTLTITKDWKGGNQSKNAQIIFKTLEKEKAKAVVTTFKDLYSEVKKAYNAICPPSRIGSDPDEKHDDPTLETLKANNLQALTKAIDALNNAWAEFKTNHNIE